MSGTKRLLHVTSTRGARAGDFDWLERIDIYPEIRAGINSGETNLRIALRLGINDRTVSRYRKRMEAEA